MQSPTVSLSLVCGARPHDVHCIYICNVLGFFAEIVGNGIVEFDQELVVGAVDRTAWWVAPGNQGSTSDSGRDDELIVHDTRIRNPNFYP